MIAKGSEVYVAEEVRSYLSSFWRREMQREDLYYAYYCVPGLMCPGLFVHDNIFDCDLADAVSDGYVEEVDGFYRLAKA